MPGSASGRPNPIAWTTFTDPLQELQQLMANYQGVSVPGLPRFSGGFVGFGGYDLVRFFEPVGKSKPDVLNVPEVMRCVLLSSLEGWRCWT